MAETSQRELPSCANIQQTRRGSDPNTGARSKSSNLELYDGATLYAETFSAPTFLVQDFFVGRAPDQSWCLRRR